MTKAKAFSYSNQPILFMNIETNKIAKCGACKFYTPMGRRGGECSQLCVPVQSGWKVCSLAESPFQTLTQVSNPEAELAAVVATKKISVESSISAEENIIVESVPAVVGRLKVQEPSLMTHFSR